MLYKKILLIIFCVNVLNTSELPISVDRITAYENLLQKYENLSPACTQIIKTVASGSKEELQNILQQQKPPFLFSLARDTIEFNQPELTTLLINALNFEGFDASEEYNCLLTILRKAALTLKPTAFKKILTYITQDKLCSLNKPFNPIRKQSYCTHRNRHTYHWDTTSYRSSRNILSDVLIHNHFENYKLLLQAGADELLPECSASLPSIRRTITREECFANQPLSLLSIILHEGTSEPLQFLYGNSEYFRNILQKKNSYKCHYHNNSILECAIDSHPTTNRLSKENIKNFQFLMQQTHTFSCTQNDFLTRFVVRNYENENDKKRQVNFLSLFLQHPEYFSGNSSIDHKPLHAVCEHTKIQLPIMQALLNHTNNVDARNSLGGTVLHAVSSSLENDNYKEVVTLLSRYGADINTQDYSGNTPLNVKLYEAGEAYPTTAGNIKTLCELGANPNIANNKRITPLMKTASSGASTIMKILLAYGANPDGFGIPKMTPETTV